MKSPSKNTPSPGQLRGRLLTFVTNFIAGIGLLAFVGYYIDKKLENQYYFATLGGILLGFIWGFYEIIKLTRLLESAEKKND